MSNEAADPERLIAEALRAQAARAPVARTQAPPGESTGPAGSAPGSPAGPAAGDPGAEVTRIIRPVPADAGSGDATVAHPARVGEVSGAHPSTTGYGLLSGLDGGLALLAGDSAVGGPATARAREDTRRLGPRRIGLGSALLLAVLLGFAAGTVVGLVTLL